MKTETLKNHTSEETAYVVSDYPYGFRLRCQIRYWIETTKHGQRFVSQTSNPKRDNLVWNKPKTSTYSDLRVMYLDEQNHVVNDGFSIAYSGAEDLDKFLGRFDDETFADEYSQKIIKRAQIAFAARKYIKVTVSSGDGPRQTKEEEQDIMRSAWNQGVRDVLTNQA